MRGDGPTEQDIPDAPGEPRREAGDAVTLVAPDVVLPPVTVPSWGSDAARLAAVATAHLCILAAFLAPASRLGAGGTSIDAIGIEIVASPPALQSRSNARGRGSALEDLVVREQDGAGPPVPPAPSTLDSRLNEPSPQQEASPPPADLTVRDWLEVKREAEAQANQPVIAPRAGEGRAPDATADLRPTATDRTMSLANSISAAELLAQMEGGAAARGREKNITVADAVMAGASAGHRKEFGVAAYKAVVAVIESMPLLVIAGEVGELVVEIVVQRSGGQPTIRVLKSSGNAAFDGGILKALQLAQMPVPHPSVPARELILLMPFKYRSGASQ